MTVGELAGGNNPSAGSGAQGAFGWTLISVCTLGAVLRALHLDVPMRYDETVTYLSYASQGWEHVMTSYEHPNNHILHSLLVGWATAWLGDAPIVIRLPAFMAGCALAPAAAWVAYRMHGREAALLAAALVATAPVLIEFSTNARGYSIVSLCVLLAVGVGSTLLRGAGWLAWLAWIELGVVGLYTIPMTAIPWLGLTLWLAWGLVRKAGTRDERLKWLELLVASTVVVGVLTLTLYSGIVLYEGMDALVGNRFVAAEPLTTFLLGVPAGLAEIARHWARGVPLGLVAIALGGVALALWKAGERSEWSGLLVSLAGGALGVMLMVRNWGEPRIWQWALPLLAITAAMGLVEACERLPGLARRAWGLGVTAVWIGLMSAQIALTDPVGASLDTGASPAVEPVFDAIVDHYRAGDWVIGDFVTVEPLRYYLDRWARVNDLPTASITERAWVVVDDADSVDTPGVRARLARMGLPPLDGVRPFLTAGDASVYLFGRPAGAPDPRLLEAIDWHSGVAGHMDQARALALFRQVAEETGSVLARAWQARCSVVGCLGLPGGASPMGPSEPLLPALTELAVSGELEAAFLLATSLAEGWAGPTSPPESVAWLRRAADAGHVLAARHLAAALIAGEGVERSDSAAVEWWRGAAEAGDAEAQLQLGESYRTGQGVTADAAAARRWYERALERRHPGARSALARLRAP